MAKSGKVKLGTMGATPSRTVTVSGDGQVSSVGDFGVAVTGNGGRAISLWGGVAVGGDRSRASATKVCAAVAGLNAHAEVGDGGLARAGSGGFATGEVDSVAMVDDGAWALSLQRGIAIARIGLAQTRREGIAAAHTQPSQDGGASGIAIAGPSGLAVAFEPGVLVSAGPGGALVGFWYDKAGAHMEFQRVGDGGPHLPDTLYRFEGGAFVKLTASELAEARGKIKRWQKPWTASGQKLGGVARKTGRTAKK